MVKLTTLSVALVTAITTPADAYPIDCAILLCLAGGFPPSAECVAAKAVFIQRITPFPVEPPLQIWKCPMGVSTPRIPAIPRIVETRYSAPLQHLIPEPSLTDTFWDTQLATLALGDGAKIYKARNRPSGVIAASEFDFIRAIKVWQLEYLQERTRGGCERRNQSRLGTYDLQGAYTWTPHSLRNESIVGFEHNGFDREKQPIFSYSWDAPLSATIHEADVRACGTFSYRAVVVTWTDYLGNPSAQEVRY